MQIADYVFKTRYAKYLRSAERRESWEECVDRTITMHEQRVGRPLHHLRGALLHKEILGSQRILQFAGAPLKKNNYRAYNCTASAADRPEFFSEFYYLLLSGCGAGYSVEYHYVYQLPRVREDSGETKYHPVPDTIEGWADAVRAVTDHFFCGGPLPIFDFSEIREKGAPISHGGRAPGPEVLITALSKTILILRHARDSKLEPVEVFRICCILADSIITERRSATICIFSPEDKHMMKAKVGDWFSDHPYYARANISPRVTTEEQLREVMILCREWGEPGLFFGNGIPNPCLEIGMNPEGGWSFCNLTTINCATLKDSADFLARCSLAAELGTIQATYTKLGYLGKRTQEIMQRDALLGVSLCGVVDSPIELTDALLRAGVEVIRTTNASCAAEFGINEAKRLTCIKPEGTTSLLLGCVGAGIHQHPAEAYYRRIQSSPGCPITEYHQVKLPQSVEDNIWAAGRVTTFPITTESVEADTAMSTLRRILRFQRNWVLPGTNDKNPEAPRHNVSCTVVVEEGEWEAAEQFVWAYRDVLTGVSFLPAMDNNKYKQLPREPVDADNAEFKELMDAYEEAEIDYNEVREESEGALYDEGACSGPKCEVSLKVKD